MLFSLLGTFQQISAFNLASRAQNPPLHYLLRLRLCLHCHGIACCHFFPAAFPSPAHYQYPHLRPFPDASVHLAALSPGTSVSSLHFPPPATHSFPWRCRHAAARALDPRRQRRSGSRRSSAPTKAAHAGGTGSGRTLQHEVSGVCGK